MGTEMSLLVGTCGYGDYRPPEGWRERYDTKLQAYSEAFDVLEVNRTFYKLPMVKTASKWAEEARDLVFTVKAWQAITHPTSSPTWRKRKEGLSEDQRSNFGHFSPNREVFEAWEGTRERAEAMGAEVCLFQSPAAFSCTRENEENLREFLGSIDRGGLRLAWEPRGDWNLNLDRVKEVCDDLEVIHVVDVMRREPVSDHAWTYIRLHGLNEREYDYNYEYSKEEISDLARRLEDLRGSHDRVFCLFNNTAMIENARSLLELLRGE
ncbi:MAG: DUF72 domain-containing protein [Methanomassiliicoccales archaeon]